MSHLRLNTTVGETEEQEFQRLLRERHQMDARLATLSQHRSSIHKQHPRRRSDVPRSYSSTGATGIPGHLSASDRVDVPSTMRRAVSQRTAPSMARNNSRGTKSQRTGNLPFTANGPMPPPLHTEPRQDNPAMTAWSLEEQPLSEYTFQYQPSQQQTSIHQQTDPEQVSEMQEPIDFIRRQKLMRPSPPTLTPTMSYNRYADSLNMQVPSTPSDSLTNATTLTSMSRSNSRCTDTMLEDMQMMRVNSSNSYAADDQVIKDQRSPFQLSLHSRSSSAEEQSLLLTGAGGASYVSQFSPLPIASSPFFHSEKMEKSQSNDSNSSSSSSRNRKRLRDTNNAALATIKPKGVSEETLMSRGNSSQSMLRLGSKGGSDKMAISPKSSYTRPKHERVFCDKCDTHTEGFRGEHELRRHQDREHKIKVKKFICVEPTDGRSHPQPVQPLAKCKACNQQKRRYNAYYNAAAHLRRAHFKPKALKGRGKSSNLNGDNEKRGGKGGGDWPDMKELKAWMKEVEEFADGYLTKEQADADDADADDDEEPDTDHAFSQSNVRNSGFNEDFQPDTTHAFSQPNFHNNSFNEGFQPDTLMMTHAFMPNPNLNLDTFGMQMPINFTTTQASRGMDTSMFTDSSNSQQSFFSSSDPYQSNPLIDLYRDPSISFPMQDFSPEDPNFVHFPPNPL